MTTVILLGLHGGRTGGIFITCIFGNFYTKRGGGEFLTFKTGIPGGLAIYPVMVYHVQINQFSTPQCTGKLFIFIE